MLSPFLSLLSLFSFQVFGIRIPSNPTTGYTWMLVEDNVPNGLELLGCRYKRHPPNGNGNRSLIGQGGDDTWSGIQQLGTSARTTTSQELAGEQINSTDGRFMSASLPFVCAFLPVCLGVSVPAAAQPLSWNYNRFVLG